MWFSWAAMYRGVNPFYKSKYPGLPIKSRSWTCTVSLFSSILLVMRDTGDGIASQEDSTIKRQRLTWDCVLMSAPRFTRIFTTSAWPAREDMWSAVFPFWINRKYKRTMRRSISLHSVMCRTSAGVSPPPFPKRWISSVVHPQGFFFISYCADARVQNETKPFYGCHFLSQKVACNILVRLVLAMVNFEIFGHIQH